MKLTRHNGRSGIHGTYNPKHNDRRFDLDNSAHIDNDRAQFNVYWDCYQGFHFPQNKDEEERIKFSFEEIESIYYFEHYDDFCEAQHERNRKNGHSERDRTTDDLRLNKKTSPEESIIQIGTIEQSVSPETLLNIAIDFFDQFEKHFGQHVHILDWSLHLDEATPHIHERHVFDCKNRYGEIAPQQEKALEVLRVPLPHPDQKPGRSNNRKMTFDSICRELLFDITLKHGLHLDKEPEYGGREYLEKQDFILEKQRELISERQQSLDEITMKLSDADTLLDEVSAVAYDKACDLVIDTVVKETQKETIKSIDEFGRKLLSSEQIHNKKERSIIASTINSVMSFMSKIKKQIVLRVKSVLLDDTTANQKKAEIKEAARTSVIEKLCAAEKEAIRRSPEVKAKNKSRDISL